MSAEPLWGARTEAVLLAGLVIVALALRLWSLATLPTNVTADEADNLALIYRILDGKGPSFFGLDWTQLPAFNVYLQAAFIRLVGDGHTIIGLRLPSALLSVAALAPFYFYAKRYCGQLAALVAAILLATSPWYLNFSRSGWENVWIACWVISALLLVELGLERQSWWYFVGAGAFCAFALYGYYAGRVVLPLLLVCAPFYSWRLRGTSAARRVVPGFALVAGVCLLLFAPQARTIIQEWSLANQRTGAVTIFGDAHNAQELLQILLNQVSISVRAFVLLDPNLGYNNRYTQPGWSYLDLATGVVFWLGLVLGVIRWRQTIPWWIFFGGGVLSLQIATRNIPDGARAVGFAPIVYLFVALALGEALQWQRKLFLPIDWALCLLVPFVAIRTFGAYVSWAGSAELAQVREPAVELNEFSAWQQAQEADAAAGRAVFNVLEWKQRVASGQVGAVAPSGAPGASSAPPASPEAPPPNAVPADEGASTAPHVGQLTATLGTDGSGKLSQPHGLAVDSAGNLYVVDTGNQRVVKLDPSGNVLLTLSPHLAQRQAAEVFDVAVEGTGVVDVLDSARGVVDRFDANGTYQATLLGDLGLYRPRALAVGPNGNLFVADTGRNRVLEVTPSGTQVASVDQASGVALDQPTGVAVAADGTLFVAEPDAALLIHASPTGQAVATRVIDRTDTLNAAHLGVLPDGDVLLADPGERALSVLSPSLQRLAYVGPSGPSGPLAVSAAVAPNGDVWVVDEDRGAVLRVGSLSDLPAPAAPVPTP